MPIGNIVQCWKPMLVLLMLGLPLHAQSESALSSWLLKAGLLKTGTNGDARDDFGPGYRDRAIDPDACPPDPKEITETPHCSQSESANAINSEFMVDSAWLHPHTSQYDSGPGSPQPIAALDRHPSRTAEVDNYTGERSKSSSSAVVRPQNQPEVHRGAYYRNKLEFGFDGGWLPINIPFVFDVFLGDAYTMTSLRYTLVPLIASLRWQIDDVGGPWIFRGNWDMTVSGSVTLIPRGPETRYFSYDMGIRRNFVPHRGKIAPYFDGRLGLGEIDAKEPLGVQFAQGQNFTFTMNLGSGVRYNFNPRYSLSVGLNWMHISNLYLSEPAFSNYGINVYGPMFGIDIRLRKPRGASE